MFFLSRVAYSSDLVLSISFVHLNGWHLVLNAVARCCALMRRPKTVLLSFGMENCKRKIAKLCG